MSNSTTIVEGCLKYRDGRKWKARWGVITKLSPVADCLHLQIYRDSKERCKNGTTKSSLSLDGFLGMETGFTLEKESNTIAIICREIVVLLAFDTREVLIQWQVKIRSHLSEEQQFLVQITNLPPKSKISCGPARLHLQDHAFCLVSGIPPRLLGYWPLKELRRFGVIDGKFCFEGGSQCGKGEGLHILHTNQTEELANCFELSSQGKLHGKRRISLNKNSSIEGSVRMSLQQTKCHKSCECGSNESSRPLISSDSENSVCDACSEIIRFNASNYDNEMSCDEQYSSRSTCCTILRCSSNLSCSGGQPYISSASVAADNECFFTSSPSIAMLNNCTDNRRSIHGLSNADSNTLPRTANDSNRCSWASSCNRCGHHYYTENNVCTDDVSNKTLPNNTISAINLSDLRSISPTSIRDCLRHHNNCHQIHNSNKSGSILPDRASLCSQSSHSSGASNSSNSSSSHSSGRCNCANEYSVPRTQHKPHFIVDMLYDRPKNIQHKVCNINNKSDQMAFCSCQLDQIDVTNRNVAFGHKTISTGMKTNNLPENFNDLSIMPLKDFDSVKCHQIEDCNAQHYAVPRTALAHIYLKELKQTQNSILDDMSENIQNPFGEQYDVPRKYRDSMNQQSSQSGLCSCAVSSLFRKRNSNSSFESNNCNSDASIDINRMPNNSALLINNAYQTSVKAINQFMVGSRQNFDSYQQSSDWIRPQLLNPLRIQRLTISQQSDCRPDKHLSTNSYVANAPESIVVNNVNGDKTSIIEEVQQQSKTTQCNSKVDFVSIDSVNKEPNMLTHSTSPITPNYVNMHFVQSIAFYENIKCKEGLFKYNNEVMDRKTKDPMPVPVHNDKNDEHYELMSFNDKNLGIKSIENKSIDNYMLMQPIMSNKTTYLKDENTQKIIDISAKPTIHHLIETVKNEKQTNIRLSESPLKTNILYSGPLYELKKKLFRQRSNSTEGRNRNYKSYISKTSASSCPSSPSLNSKSCIYNRHYFIFSKLSYKSKEKSFSIDDISPTQLSISSNHYFKFGQSISFHKSADCLRQRTDDYRSSEEDLCTSSQITVLCASPAKTSCLSAANRPSNQILSNENCDVVDDTSANIIHGNKTQAEPKAQINLNDNLNFVDSTSSSDMSDYVETLSLSSRTSSGSDPTYVRSEDLTSKSLSINSISLKPRSIVEYSTERKMIDCTTQLHNGLTDLLLPSSES